MDHIRYPIGPFAPSEPSTEARAAAIGRIEGLARSLRALVRPLDEARLRTPYRPGGWTVRQVVHHMADNDMNAYIRLKRALTEDAPLAPSYREKLWAELPDGAEAPVELSLALLEALHGRLALLLRGLGPDDFARVLSTEALGTITVDIAVQRFLWHHDHHMAQIAGLKERMGW